MSLTRARARPVDNPALAAGPVDNFGSLSAFLRRLVPMQPGPPGGAQAYLLTLDAARRRTVQLAGELLSHQPDLGDYEAQRTLDGWVEQAADSLHAVASLLEYRLIDAGRAAQAADLDRTPTPTAPGLPR